MQEGVVASKQAVLDKERRAENKRQAAEVQLVQ